MQVVAPSLRIAQAGKYALRRISPRWLSEEKDLWTQFSSSKLGGPQEPQFSHRFGNEKGTASVHAWVPQMTGVQGVGSVSWLSHSITSQP